MTVFSLLLCLLVLLVLVLLFVCARSSLRQEASGTTTTGWGVGTRYFLILLRLAIGWHFLVEGLDKVQSPAWSSDGYLREATGPLAPVFRELAGERLIARLSLGSDGALPEELSLQWQEYLDGVISHYGLDGEQAARVKTAMDQTRSKAVGWLTTKPRLVEIPSATPPPLQVAMTMPQRLKDYEKLKAEFVAIDEGDRVGYGPEPFEAWKAARARWRAWRADLSRDAALLERHMRRALRTVLLGFVLEDLPAESRKRVEAEREAASKEAQKAQIAPGDWDQEEAVQEKAEAKVLGACRAELVLIREKEATGRLCAVNFEDRPPAP